MYCMCPRCVGGWLYPFASSGDFSMRGESENGKVGNIEPVERKTTKKKPTPHKTNIIILSTDEFGSRPRTFQDEN